VDYIGDVLNDDDSMMGWDDDELVAEQVDPELTAVDDYDDDFRQDLSRFAAPSTRVGREDAESAGEEEFYDANDFDSDEHEPPQASRKRGRY